MKHSPNFPRYRRSEIANTTGGEFFQRFRSIGGTKFHHSPPAQPRARRALLESDHRVRTRRPEYGFLRARSGSCCSTATTARYFRQAFSRHFCADIARENDDRQLHKVRSCRLRKQLLRLLRLLPPLAACSHSPGSGSRCSASERGHHRAEPCLFAYKSAPLKHHADPNAAPPDHAASLPYAAVEQFEALRQRHHLGHARLPYP